MMNFLAFDDSIGILPLLTTSFVYALLSSIIVYFIYKDDKKFLKGLKKS